MNEEHTQVVEGAAPVDAKLPILTDEPTSDMKVSTSHEGLKELIEKNIKWSQVVYYQNKAIKRRLTLMTIANYLRLLILIAPIALGIIFLPPFIIEMRQQFEQYMMENNGKVELPQLIEYFFDNNRQVNGDQAR